MFAPLLIVLPIFGLIFAGWLTRRLGVLGPHATTELNRFVVYLALPALLFDIIAHAKWADVWQPGFIAAFGLGAGLIFVLTLAMRLRRPRHLADAVIDGLNAGYANVGFVGFPLVAVALGPEALAPTLVATIITVCVLFGIAIVLIELGLQTERQLHRLITKTAKSLLRNPLLVAPILGALIPLSGLTIPAPAESFLKLLGGAASPCALVALGLFLAGQSTEKQPSHAATTVLVALKLILQPVITWIMAAVVFQLSPLLTHAAVLLAALPTGTGPFMLAEFYRREAGITGRVVLASTIVSVATITVYLTLTAS
jgi:malonate transporter and related proteins